MRVSHTKIRERRLPCDTNLNVEFPRIRHKPGDGPVAGEATLYDNRVRVTQDTFGLKVPFRTFSIDQSFGKLQDCCLGFYYLVSSMTHVRFTTCSCSFTHYGA